MITITRKPDSIMLSENPIPLEVLITTDDGQRVVEVGGSRSRIISRPGVSGLPANTSLGLSWTMPGGGSFRVGFHTDGPFPTAYEIPEYVSGSLDVYWDDLADVIGSNPDVAPWFFVYAEMNVDGTYSLWAVARETDAEWIVNWTGADDETVFTVEPSSYPDTFEQLRVRCDVMVNTDEGYRLAGSVGCAPKADSRVDWNLAKILSGFILSDLPYPSIPSWSTSAPYLSDQKRTYSLRISELSEGEFQDVKYLRDLEVLKGGVANFLNARGNYLLLSTPVGVWLGSRPDRRRVGVNEPVYMASIRGPLSGNAAPGFTGGAYLEIEETDNDGDVTTREFTSGGTRVTADVETNQPIVWAVGVATLGISVDTVYYRFRVMQDNVLNDSSQALTPWRTFIVDRTEYESVRYLAYLNSFFLPEVLRCIGSVSQSMQVNTDTMRRVRPSTADVSVPDNEMYSAGITDRYSFATGYKEKLEIETVLHELMRSPRLYEITPTGYTPLLATGQSFQLDQTNKNLHSAIIDCELALEDQSYSRIDDQLSIPPPDYWQSPDGENWTSPDETPWRN